MGRRQLTDEEPLPTPDAIGAFEAGNHTSGEKSSKGAGQNCGSVKICHPLAELVLPVPRTEKKKLCDRIGEGASDDVDRTSLRHPRRTQTLADISDAQ